MPKFRHIIVCIILTTATLTCRGVITILADPSDFQTATDLLDFETFLDDTIVPYTSSDLTDQWLPVGVRISDDSTANGASAYSGTFSIPPHSGIKAIADSVNSAGGFVEFAFVVPGTTTPTTVQEAGIWVLNGDQGSTVTFFASDNSILQTLTPSTGTSFAGIRSTEGIARVRITDPDFYLVDDLQFSTIPEPTVAFLIPSGLAVILMTCSRRRLRVRFA